MASGSRCLAQLWDSAWKEGGGDHSITRFEAIDEETLEGLYRNPDFLHPYTLDTISPVLRNGNADAGDEAAPPRSVGVGKRRRRLTDVMNGQLDILLTPIV
jgi:hypothetical protein